MEISLTLKNYRCFSDTKPATIRIRDGFIAFVGVNNAGKSSLLKFFYEFRQMFAGVLRFPDFGQAIGIRQIGNAWYGPASFQPQILLSDPEGIFCKANDRPLQIELDVLESDTEPGTTELERGIPAITQAHFTLSRSPGWEWQARVRVHDAFLDDLSGLSVDGERLVRNGQPVARMTPLLKACGVLANTYYVGPFRNALNLESTNASLGYYDIAVGKPFIQQWREALSGMNSRRNEAAYKLTSDIKRIFRYNDLQFHPTPDDQTVTVVIDGESFKLNELGSGLAQFFLVLANAATRYPAPSYILIDEPELNLHPSLQLDFLTTLASYAQHGILFATHSLGLARTIAHPICAVYRDQNGISTVSDFEDTREWSKFIGELSFSGRSDMGFDTLLLVEGKWDVPTVHEFLRLYGKDHRVMVWPMNGSETIHSDAEPQLAESKRITDRVFALIDSERTYQGEPLRPERQGFVEACERAGVTCKVLDDRAIENYLADGAVKAVVGSKARALAPFQARSEIKPMWHKSQNWRIASRMRQEDLEGTDLGEFLKEL